MLADATYAPLPSTVPPVAANFPSTGQLAALADVTSVANISDVVAQLTGAASGGSAADLPTLRFFVAFSALGSFIVRPACALGAAAGSLDVVKRVAIALSSGGAAVDISAVAGTGATAGDVASAAAQCVIFNPSADALARNLTSARVLGVRVQVATQSGQTGVVLDSLPLNFGPVTNVTSAWPCAIEVPRATRFAVDLGYVFTHPLGLPLQIDRLCRSLREAGVRCTRL